MRKNWHVKAWGIGVVWISLLSSWPVSAQEARSVAEKVYTIYVFQDPDQLPFQDCARFSENTMTLDLCGDAGGMIEYPLPFEPPPVKATQWIGFVPCDGLNLVFIGNSIDGSTFGAADALGGYIVRRTDPEVDTFGFAGLQDPDCTVDPGPYGNVNPYALRYRSR